jgi:hypothetical protein
MIKGTVAILQVMHVAFSETVCKRRVFICPGARYIRIHTPGALITVCKASAHYSSRANRAAARNELKFIYHFAPRAHARGTPEK